MVTIRFTDFGTHDSKDTVRVIACANAACADEADAYVLSGTYASPPVITSITGFMKVTFETDGAAPGPGFSASWNAVSAVNCGCGVLLRTPVYYV